MRILIGHECSGRVRDAFRRKGHDAISCDFKPSERPGPHLQCDIITVLHLGWDMAIFFPDCTYLCGSGIHWNNRGRGWGETEQALEHVRLLLDVAIPLIALENPVGIISTRIRKPDQYLQPYEFGEDASKLTCLWLKGLAPLCPTLFIPPRIVAEGPYKGKKRWANQTDSGQNKLAPSKTRAADRSRTYQGIADAMPQWLNGKADSIDRYL